MAYGHPQFSTQQYGAIAIPKAQYNQTDYWHMKQLEQFIERFKPKPKKAQPELPQVDLDAVRNADPYDYQTAARRMAFMVRLTTFYAVSVTIALIISLTSFQAILPLKEIRLALLRIDPAESRIYQVEPISKQVPGFKLLLEQKAQEFVASLMKVDKVTQRERFTNAIDLSLPDLRKTIMRDFVESGLIDDLLQADIVRDITIVGVDHLISFSPDVWKLVVDYDQTDLKGTKRIEVKNLRAYLSMTTRPQTVTEAEKYENPLGIRILDMAIKFRGNEPQDNQE